MIHRIVIIHEEMQENIQLKNERMEVQKMMMAVILHVILNQCISAKMEAQIKLTPESYVQEVSLLMMTRMNAPSIEEMDSSTQRKSVMMGMRITLMGVATFVSSRICMPEMKETSLKKILEYLAQMEHLQTLTRVSVFLFVEMV